MAQVNIPLPLDDDLVAFANSGGVAESRLQTAILAQLLRNSVKPPAAKPVVVATEPAVVSSEPAVAVKT